MAGPVEWLQGTWPALVAFLLAPATLVVLTSFSLVTCLVSLFGVSWVLRRLPVDYLMTAPGRPSTRRGQWWRALRNLVGVVLLLLGVLMLVLPGQGLLTILAALSLMDFQGKRRLECRLMSIPRVLSAINRFRLRSGQPRLLSPAPHRLDDG